MWNLLDCCFRQSGRNRKWTACSRLQWIEMQFYFTNALWYLKWCCNQRVSNCIGFLFVCFASADNSLWKLWIYFQRYFDASDETKHQVLDKICKPKSCIVKAFYKGIRNVLANLDFIIIHICFMNCTWYAENRALVQMTGKVTFSLLEKKNFT